ncbi:uncharacterized protein LOC131954881 [Physella acuta]|uniref:uncharacterized protein LOC131954881 n=1 Tax=Physella acuta TaxID=109671 RepID=UPI0027DC8BDA|nr:uncharacterized protein LOC131954881 [Physella acuta]
MASLLSRRVSVAGTNKVKDKSSASGTADTGALDCSKHSELGKKMTLQEKLDFIDGEIRKIHMFCTKSGYSASQIEHFAEPFLNRSSSHISSVIWVSGKAWKRRAVALTTVIVATLFLFRYDPAYKLASAISKQGAIQVLPLWDWTSDCLVINPLHVSNDDLDPSKCEVCESIDRVARIKNATADRVMDDYVRRDIPVIVTDGTKDWATSKKNLSIGQIAEAYNNNPVLNKYDSCGYLSNLRKLDHLDTLAMISAGKLDKFFAHWINCNYYAAKAFRSLYQRPYFVPQDTVYIDAYNWLSVSANYSGKIYKNINISDSMMLYIQVKGQSRVKVESWKPCDDLCSKFEELLREGEILVVSGGIWRLYYLPLMAPESISFVLTGSF